MVDQWSLIDSIKFSLSKADVSICVVKSTFVCNRLLLSRSFALEKVEPPYHGTFRDFVIVALFSCVRHLSDTPTLCSNSCSLATEDTCVINLQDGCKSLSYPSDN